VAMKKIAADVQRALQTLISKNLIRVKRNKLWVEVEINDSVLFASGQAAINPKAVDVVKDLAKILAPFPNVVRVEGFTDNVPIDNNVYPSNWELSSARAASVVRMMSHHGIDPRRLLAVGYGKYHPIADNKTVDGRHKNRRVTLVVLAKGASELAIKADPANLRETKGADGGGRPSAHTAVASINPKKKADLTVGSGGHPPSSGGPGRAAPVKRAAPGGKGLQVPPRATAAQGALQGAQGAAVPRRGGLIPPPIQLAAPIKLPTPLGLPMASPLPLPNSAKGKQP
ncbi:MAG TPA: OmpA family protein, partial [Gammaproteobacteria bacterium]|nr:OmpA family protein [Gammaproteobacteria bacterium]